VRRLQLVRSAISCGCLPSSRQARMCSCTLSEMWGAIQEMFHNLLLITICTFVKVHHATTRGLYLARVNPYGFHMESMESIRYSMWNPWNHCWLRPQPIYCSMDIMDSMWNDHGMVMEWLIPYGIQLYSTWIPLDSIWNLGISTLDSIWIPLKFHMENTTIFVVKNSVKYEN